MKILWSSNAPWAASGYGQQTALFAPRFKAAGHDVAINAVWGLQGGCWEWEGIPVYPSDGKWGNEYLTELAAKHGGGDPSRCLTITLHDVYVLEPRRVSLLDLACWCPVDHDPVPAKVTAVFQATGARPIAMSRFGEDRLREAGLEPLYVPHGIDTKVFGGVDRDDARERLGIPEGAFVVGMVAANTGNAPSRKAFPEVFQAFARFHRDHPEAILYLHTDIVGRNMGINIAQLVEACGIPSDAVGSSPQLMMQLGMVAPADMADAFASFDVLVNPSLGEGFGIPIIEAQAAGTPVIVGDWTAMPELCGAGWTVSGQRSWDQAQASWWHVPDVDEVTEALFAAYDSAAGMRDEAKRFAARYDVDTVMADYWAPVLEQLARPREVAPLAPPNRAARRATARQKVPA